MNKKMLKSIFISLSTLLLLEGCSINTLYTNDAVSKAHITDDTAATGVLMSLQKPARSVPAVVYEFQDQTGQFKNNGSYTDYSSAVTRGGYSILVKALLDAGGGDWFMLAERGALKNLLQERQIINMTRGEYNAHAKNDDQKLPSLSPMLYGGTLIEGGIISYDSNIMSGGLGATYLGIGGATQYRRDLVTVYLRAVSVDSGRVLLSVQSSKTIYSVSLDGTFMRYLTVGNLFQSEAGFAINEPVQFGVRQAIETAVYSLIMEGAMKNLWEFKDKEAGAKAISEYIQRREASHNDMPASNSNRPDKKTNKIPDQQTGS
jgi:curli production assembly/transport component CsgG